MEVLSDPPGIQTLVLRTKIWGRHRVGRKAAKARGFSVEVVVETLSHRGKNLAMVQVERLVYCCGDMEVLGKDLVMRRDKWAEEKVRARMDWAQAQCTWAGEKQRDTSTVEWEESPGHM